MTDSVHTIACQIERIIHPTSFRGTPWVQFQRPDGYFLVEAWFERGQPMMQIRSNVESDNPLGTAAIVAQAIHMAIDWLTEMADAGRNVP